MKRKNLLTLWLAVLTAGLSFNLSAANEIELRVVAQQEIEAVDESGKKTYKMVPVEKIVPGDEVVYTIYFKNVANQPATDIVIDDPVPQNMSYKANSAYGSGTVISYSVDGGKTFAGAEALQVEKDGKKVAATAADYSHIRWNFGATLEPGKEAYVGFRATLN